MKDKTRNRRNYCYPHKGNFDYFDNPVDEFGKPIMAGARTCNHSDCVRPEHVITAIQMEWLDISYKTKTKKNYQEIYKAIVNEAIRT
jgi:hypothetical protein